MNMPKNNLMQQIFNTDVVVYSAYSTFYFIHAIALCRYLDKIDINTQFSYFVFTFYCIESQILDF